MKHHKYDHTNHAFCTIVTVIGRNKMHLIKLFFVSNVSLK